MPKFVTIASTSYTYIIITYLSTNIFFILKKQIVNVNYHVIFKIINTKIINKDD